MKVDFRIPAIAAGAAFLVAFLTGVLAGVGFGAILLRAILGAAAFALLGVGGDSVARKSLPELFPAKSEDSNEGDGRDEGIDITIDEENPHEREQAEQPRGADESLSINDADAEDVEELETIDETGTESGAGAAAEAQAGSPESAPSGGTTQDRPSAELPSFDSVENTFEAPAGEATAPSPQAPVSVDVMGHEENPEAIAKAVRTLLKRDGGEG